MATTHEVNPTPADLERLDNELNLIARQKNDHLPEVADGTMSGSITVHRPPDPMAMVAAAIDKGMDPQKILDFIERANEMKAKEKYAEAITKFQTECPQVLRERNVPFKGGQGSMYKFAAYDDILKSVGPLLKECGIAVTFNVSPKIENNLMFGTCRIRVGSYFEDTTMPVPISKGLNTNASQDFGGTLTYLKRYLFCAALNIVITDNLEKDTDGNSPSDLLTEEQIAEVEAGLKACTETGNPIKNVVKWLDWVNPGLTAVKDMHQRFLQLALNDLERRAKPKGASNANN